MRVKNVPNISQSSVARGAEDEVEYSKQIHYNSHFVFHGEKKDDH